MPPPLLSLFALALDMTSRIGGPLVVVYVVAAGAAAAAAAVAAAPHRTAPPRSISTAEGTQNKHDARYTWIPSSHRLTHLYPSTQLQQPDRAPMKSGYKLAMYYALSTCLRERPEAVVLWTSLRPSLNLCHDVGLVGANFVPCSGAEDAVLGRQPAVLRGSLARDETHGLSEV